MAANLLVIVNRGNSGKLADFLYEIYVEKHAF